MKKVIITGASGFVGGHLVDENLKRGNVVRVLVLEGDPKEEVLREKGIEVIIGNITDFECVAHACDGMDIIFHCAGIVTDWAPKQLYLDVNVLGMENICKAAVKAKVERLVYMSTNDVFGPIEDVVMDETFPLKKWGEPYPDTKIDAEEIAWKYFEEFQLPITMVYACWVYGKGDITFVPLLADAIIKKELIFWRKDVHVWPTYIDNLIDLLMIMSVDQRAIGKGYLVHDGEMVTLQDFCEEIARTLDVPPITTYIPYWLAKFVGWFMEKWWRLMRKKSRPLLTTYTVTNLGSRFNFSIDKAKRELDWVPKISYNEGMETTMQWLKTLDFKTLKEK